MPVIELETIVNAPATRVFDLARCIDLHTESMSGSHERAVEGVTFGLIDLGETVTWEAVHFGIKQNLTSEITQFDRPHHFRDSMLSGAFKRLGHDHYFTDANGRTLMRDVFDYTSPLGLLGRLMDELLLENYMKRLLEARNELIREAAESDRWQNFLD